MIFRIILGLYLLYHFIPLVPYAEELFGNDMPYDYTESPLYGIFPNILDYVNATYFIFYLIVLSVCLVLEYNPRLVAFILWYGWACLFNRNILISNPGIPFVGWSLLALVFVERDEERIVFNTNNKFLKYIQQDKFPKRVYWMAWIIMSAGYTASGLHKLMLSPSWYDGTALQHVLEGCLARDNFLRDFVIQYPTFLKYSTWFSLFLEISFLPLGVFYRTRFIFWITYMFFHFGILLLINFTDLTFGMLIIHLFTFDWRWTSYFNEYIAQRMKQRMEEKYGFTSLLTSFTKSNKQE